MAIILQREPARPFSLLSPEVDDGRAVQRQPVRSMLVDCNTVMGTVRKDKLRALSPRPIS